MDKEFNEDCAISYIRKNAKTTRKYSTDDILNLIDIVWDYYEDKGLLSLEFDDEMSDDETVDRDELVAHTARLLAKDKGNKIVPEDVAPLVDAELAYEVWLEEE